MILYKLIRIVTALIGIVARVTRPYFDTALDVLLSLLMGKTKVLPPIDNEILLMSATELSEKIRKRQISSERVVRAYVTRAKAVNPVLNAVVDERYEEAIKDAIEVDKMLATTSKTEEEIATETPLLGLPFTVKECVGVKGLAQTAGIFASKDRKAEDDGDTTALYRKAGAIPVTVTNVPELLFWWDSTNRVFGMTKNPYDNRRTVGGSTGGEAALIASAGALFGIGTDIGGSIRIPSSFNGIYGHKPTKGVISNERVYPHMKVKPGVRVREFSTAGPMCRYAQDLPLLFRILSDNDERVQLDRKVDFKNLTVYYMEELPGYLLAAVPMVKNAIRKAVKHFEEEYGIKAIKLKIDELSYTIPMYQAKLLEYGSLPFSSAMAGEGNTINLTHELVKSIFGYSNHTLPAIYYGMIERRDKDKTYNESLKMFEDVEQKMSDILQDKDAILLVPTHPEPPPHCMMTIPKFQNISYTCIFNLLGLPSTNIPTGLSDQGLPFGIQAVSGKFHDHLSLAAAMELDKVFKGWRSPCPITV